MTTSPSSRCSVCRHRGGMLSSMPVTVTLELKIKPESVAAARDVFARALVDTRAFPGNLGTDVLVDENDEGHWLIYELVGVRRTR